MENNIYTLLCTVEWSWTKITFPARRSFNLFRGSAWMAGFTNMSLYITYTYCKAQTITCSFRVYSEHSFAVLFLDTKHKKSIFSSLLMTHEIHDLPQKQTEPLPSLPPYCVFLSQYCWNIKIEWIMCSSLLSLLSSQHVMIFYPEHCAYKI